MRNLLVAALIVVVSGCISTTLRNNFQKNGGLSRAAFDLKCPQEKVEYTRLDGDLDAVLYSAGATVGASGCGRSTAYVLSPGGMNGSWIRNGEISEDPAPAPQTPAQ